MRRGRCRGPHGALGAAPADESLRVYGSDARAVAGLAAEDPSLGERLDPRLPYSGAHVVYGVRAEMARTVADVLARRTRALFLDAEAARACAPRAASLIAAELGLDRGWIEAQLSDFDRVIASRRGNGTLV